MNKYKCLDCNKSLGDLKFPQEIIEKCPKGSNGVLFVICNECVEEEERQERFKQALLEVERIENGTLPKKSARELLDEIRKD